MCVGELWRQGSKAREQCLRQRVKGGGSGASGSEERRVGKEG